MDSLYLFLSIENDLCHAADRGGKISGQKQRFDIEVMDTIVKLLESDDEDATDDIIRDAVDALLFAVHWKVKKWFKLQGFTSTDVAVTLNPPPKEPFLCRSQLRLLLRCLG
jgi:hypothetical protein